MGKGAKLGSFPWGQEYAASAQSYRHRTIAINGKSHCRHQPRCLIPLEGALLFPNLARVDPLSK